MIVTKTILLLLYLAAGHLDLLCSATQLTGLWTTAAYRESKWARESDENVTDFSDVFWRDNDNGIE